MLLTWVPAFAGTTVFGLTVNANNVVPAKAGTQVNVD